MYKIRHSPVLIFALFLAVLPLLSRLLGVFYYVDVMVFAGVYSLITIGLSLLMGFAGQISLGHAAFFGIGAYVSGILTATYGLSPWLCVLAGMLVSAFVGLLVGAPSLKLRGHYLAMATLAFGIIIFIVFNEETEFTGGPDGLSRIPGLSLFGFDLNTTVKYYYFTWAVVLAAFLFTANIIQSRVGRALRSIHDSETASNAMGVNVALCKIQVFVYSAVLASIAGSLYAHYVNFINPSTFDLFFSIKLLIMIMTGGIHNLWGAILGAILITFLSNEWLHYLQEFEVLAYGAILLAIVIFLPNGLAGVPDIVLRLIRRRESAVSRLPADSQGM